MVINSGGGNKGKHVARKFVKSGAGAGIKTVRLVQDEGEMYAVVVKLFGNCMCKVMCFDGRSRLCIIRKKFTGRRKTDNIVSSGSVVLVGLQVYGSSGTSSSSSSGTSSSSKTNHGDSHLPRCDLLYVYNDQEKEKLRKVCDIGKMNAAPTTGGFSEAQSQLDDDSVKFVSSGTGVFNKYANQELRNGLRSVGGGVAGSLTNDDAAPARIDTIDGTSWLKDMYPDDSSSDDDSDEEEEESEADDSDEDEEKEEEEEEEEKEEEEEEEETYNKPHPRQQQPKSNQSQQQQQQTKKYSIINIDDI